MNRHYSANAIRVFMSAERACYDDGVNYDRHLNLGAQIAARGFNPVEVSGCYDGRPERAYSVRCEPGEMMYLTDLASRYGQESVLVVNAYLNAKFVYVHPNRWPVEENAGLFLPTNRPRDELRGYTVMPDGSTWTVVEQPFDIEAAMQRAVEG